MTSFNLRYFLKALSPNTVALEVKALMAEEGTQVSPQQGGN